MELLQKLIDIIISAWRALMPFFVCRQYEEGVILRLGHFHRQYKVGFHWKIPLAEEIDTQDVRISTMECPPQSIITKDRTNVVVSAVVKYKPEDIKIYCLEVLTVKESIKDVVIGEIQRDIGKRTWDEIFEGGKGVADEVLGEITIALRKECKKWGIYVDRVTFGDIANVKSIRLIQDAHSDHHPAGVA